MIVITAARAVVVFMVVMVVMGMFMVMPALAVLMPTLAVVVMVLVSVRRHLNPPPWPRPHAPGLCR